MDALKDKNKSERHDWGPTNGETGPMFRARIQEFIKILGQRRKALDMDDPVILATTHGGFIKDFNLILVENYNCKMPCQSGEYGR